MNDLTPEEIRLLQAQADAAWAIASDLMERVVIPSQERPLAPNWATIAVVEIIQEFNRAMREAGVIDPISGYDKDTDL